MPCRRAFRQKFPGPDFLEDLFPGVHRWMDDKGPANTAVWCVMKNRLMWRTGLLCGVGAIAMARWTHPAPAAAFADRKAAGAELFATRGCAHCHGDDGQGTDRAPGLRTLRKKLSADKIQDQIVHGGQGMPAFGDSLQPDEVQDLVAFLRAKTWITPPAPKAAAPAPTPGS